MPENKSIIQSIKIIPVVLCFIFLNGCVDQLKPSKKDLEKIAEKESALIKSKSYYQVPTIILQEHEHLLDLAVKASTLTGKSGPKASEILKLLQHHFSAEEAFALPPLGLLPLLEKGEVIGEMKQVELLTSKLKSELPHLLVEHLQIAEQLEQLKAIAIEENQHSLLEFIDQIKQHARLEETLLFPTAILIGDYLDIKYPG